MHESTENGNLSYCLMDDFQCNFPSDYFFRTLTWEWRMAINPF